MQLCAVAGRDVVVCCAGIRVSLKDGTRDVSYLEEGKVSITSALESFWESEARKYRSYFA
jgi:hypothetical protein